MPQLGPRSAQQEHRQQAPNPAEHMHGEGDGLVWRVGRQQACAAQLLLG